MSIIRTARPVNYTVINNAVFSDEKPLSWEAIGLLCYLLSKPDNWTVSPASLANTARCGINKIHNLLKELKVHGFVVGKKSNTGVFNYLVYDNSQAFDFKPNHEKPNQEKPNQEKPNQEKPNQDLSRQLNTEYKTNTELEINTECSVVSTHEEKKSANEKTEFQPDQNQNQQTPKSSQEWIAYFVNKHGFRFHEAQTSKTVPMYVEWVKQGYMLEDVEMGIMGAMGWLSKKGKTRADSPCLFDGFIKSAIAEKQNIQAQKSPGASDNNQGLENFNSNTGTYHDTQYQQPQRKPNVAERMAEVSRIGAEFDKRTDYWISLGYSEQDAEYRAGKPQLFKIGFVCEDYSTIVSENDIYLRA